jgi:hypothetical protein
VIGDHFKERDQDVEELQYFNTYVGDVKKADGVIERLRHVTYIFTVAPDGPMKDSWERYLTLVRREKEELDSLQRLVKSLEISDTSGSITTSQKLLLDSSKQKVEQLNTPLDKNEDKHEGTYRVILGTDVSIEAAQTELEKAQKLKPNATIEERGNLFITLIETTDQTQAKLLQKKKANKVFNTKLDLLRLSGQ